MQKKKKKQEAKRKVLIQRKKERRKKRKNQEEKMSDFINIFEKKKRGKDRRLCPLRINGFTWGQYYPGATLIILKGQSELSRRENIDEENPVEKRQ